MEKKEKQLKKWNIVDVIAVFLILAVAVYAGVRLLGGGETVTSERPMVPVTFQVRAEGVPAALYENCKEHLPSPLMASGALVGGQIEAVEQETCYVLDAGGNWVPDETHTTLVFTVTTQTPQADVMTTKVGDQEVRIGKTDYILKSEYIEFSDVTITDVRWGE